MHVHHIMPRKLGGTNDPENLVVVSIEEHAKIHHSQWILSGRWQDEVAWRALSGQVGRDEARRLAVKLSWNDKQKTKIRKQKISDSMKAFIGSTSGKKHGIGNLSCTGMKMYNNGIIQKFALEKPLGFVLGRLYYNKKK